MRREDADSSERTVIFVFDAVDFVRIKSDVPCHVAHLKVDGHAVVRRADVTKQHNGWSVGGVRVHLQSATLPSLPTKVIDEDSCIVHVDSLNLRPVPFVTWSDGRKWW